MLYNRRVIHLRAPLRLSFVGGGTDFPEYFQRNPGEVISTTLDVFVYLTIKDMFDTNVRVHHAAIETEPIASRITHTYTRTALEYFGLFKGVEVIIISDVMTTGSGLGASSALMSGLVLGCSCLRNHRLTNPEDLARLTIELERQAGTVGGCQDQYATCFGGFNSISFSNDHVKVEPLALTPKVRTALEERTMLVFTNLARNSLPIQSRLAENLEQGCKDDHLDRLYQATQSFKSELLSPTVDFSQLGRILDETWQLKKEVSPGSTNPYLDELYDFMRAQGVVGGKITGAGGGGFFLTITASPEAKKALMYKLYPNYIGMEVKFHPRGTEVLWKSF
jgi:D-glycero-alpha-D-manno-heptose-7-phosphate kinase